MMFNGRGPGKPGTPSGRRWHAVSVVTKSGSCCEAARAIRHMRFLSAEAPRLPLVGCARPERCSCAYKHFEDRRAQARRKEDIDGLRRSIQGREERRSHGDRRAAE